MKVLCRVWGIGLLWSAAWAVPALAQQATEAAVGDVAMAQSAEEADRAALRAFLSRSEVRKAAEIGRVDLQRIEDGVEGLEGEELHRAATQARAIDSRLGEPSSADVISIRTTTLIIILLLVIIVVLIA